MKSWIWRPNTLRFPDKEMLFSQNMTKLVPQGPSKLSKGQRSLREKLTELPCR